MWRAWGQVRRNNGAPGIDHTTHHPVGFQNPVIAPELRL